ncbi:sulfur oxidation c-type cytochrome SoxX [Mesorhizobium sp. M0768]|uniref:sulfur oxidation c-type cytochrome SoxX n=1 Tax=Mesorhizobium sp. M0768 TaxID=2956996 RepID=UPI0033361121
MTRTTCLTLTGLLLAASPGGSEEVGSYLVTGDVIMEPLVDSRGDPARGAALISDRQRSLCTLCHSGPFPDAHLHGTLAPDLTGVGTRLSEGQIRLRVVDMKRLAPDTITFLPTVSRKRKTGASPLSGAASRS